MSKKTKKEAPTFVSKKEELPKVEKPTADTPQVSQFPRFLPKNAIFTGLPDSLKDPKNFEKVYKTIFEAGASTCDHTEVLEYAMCSKCQMKMKNRADTMRRLGFSSGKQYLEWLKVHQKIRGMGAKSEKGEYYEKELL